MHAHADSFEEVHGPPIPVPEAPPEAAPVQGEAHPAAVRGWTSDLLGAGSGGLAADARRFATGLGLAAAYGLALGTRHGSRAFFSHAFGVPAGLLAVTALGAPALYIGLALFDAPIDLRRFFSMTARAVARAGLVMAGLAPAAALYIVSASNAGAAAAAASLGLAVGGILGLSALLQELRGTLMKGAIASRFGTLLALGAFGVFALALSMRVWSALPLFAGAR